MGITDPETNRALHVRWRPGLALAAFLMIASALVALASALAYGERPVVALPMLLGGLCVVAAFRNVPRAVLPEERPAMARTAWWIVVALLLFFGVPLVLDAVGWA